MMIQLWMGINVPPKFIESLQMLLSMAERLKKVQKRLLETTKKKPSKSETHNAQTTVEYGSHRIGWSL